MLSSSRPLLTRSLPLCVTSIFSNLFTFSHSFSLDLSQSSLFISCPPLAFSLSFFLSFMITIFSRLLSSSSLSLALPLWVLFSCPSHSLPKHFRFSFLSLSFFLAPSLSHFLSHSIVHRAFSFSLSPFFLLSLNLSLFSLPYFSTHCSLSQLSFYISPAHPFLSLSLSLTFAHSFFSASTAPHFFYVTQCHLLTIFIAHFLLFILSLQYIYHSFSLSGENLLLAPRALSRSLTHHTHIHRRRNTFNHTHTHKHKHNIKTKNTHP